MRTVELDALLPTARNEADVEIMALPQGEKAVSPSFISDNLCSTQPFGINLNFAKPVNMKKPLEAAFS